MLFASGCSTVPTVTLKKSDFINLSTAQLISTPDNNYMLQSVSTVEFNFSGMTVGDKKGIREYAIQYMEENKISLNELIRTEFQHQVQSDKLPLTFTKDSPNRLVLTINVVVLGMTHSFSDKFNALFNIAGQLFNKKDEILWSYNAIPMPPAPGYSASAEKVFESPEALKKYLSAAYTPIVKKLHSHFKKEFD